MRRFLLAGAVLLTVTASPTFAGYIIIRVLLESGGVPGADGHHGVPGGTGDHEDGFPGPGRGRPFGPPGPVGPPGGPTGGPRTGAGAHHAAPDPSRSVVVVVPLESDLDKKRLDVGKLVSQNNPEYRRFTFPYQGKNLKSFLFVDGSSIQLYEELIGTPGVKKTRHTEVRARHDAWLRGKTDTQALFDALVLALQSGFVKDALAYAEELHAVAEENKVAIPDREVKPFVAAWGAVRKAVTGAAPPTGDAEAWRLRLDYRNVRSVGHYALVYLDNRPDEVERRLAQLNDNFAAFYLWHATRGVALPVPQKPLVAVLAPDGQAMHKLHRALDGLAMADAFVAPDHNLLVLSPERMDEVGQSFLRQNQQVFVKGLNRDQLLIEQPVKSTMPPLDHTGAKGTRPEDVARASTLAAVEKLVIEDAELAAVSREGTRQLLYATDSLPKHVTLPMWLTNGSVNFFTRPRGPAYVTIGDDEKAFMHVALATGYGGPNYVLQRYFRDLATKKELPADAARLLENVLGDVYYNGIKDGDDPDPAPPKAKAKSPAGGVAPPPGGGKLPPGGFPGGSMPGFPGGGIPGAGIPGGGIPGGVTPGGLAGDHDDPAVILRKKQQRLAIKANASSWALYYYLVKHKPEQLKQYVAELNKLPRDLPIDGRTAYTVFVRVFNLSTSETGAADPKRLKEFADDWLAYVNTVPLVGHDVPLAVPTPPKTTTPGGPSIPGRPPGPGGIDPDRRP